MMLCLCITVEKCERCVGSLGVWMLHCSRFPHLHYSGGKRSITPRLTYILPNPGKTTLCYEYEYSLCIYLYQIINNMLFLTAHFFPWRQIRSLCVVAWLNCYTFQNLEIQTWQVL